MFTNDNKNITNQFTGSITTGVVWMNVMWLFEIQTFTNKSTIDSYDSEFMQTSLEHL